MKKIMIILALILISVGSLWARGTYEMYSRVEEKTLNTFVTVDFEASDYHYNYIKISEINSVEDNTLISCQAFDYNYNTVILYDTARKNPNNMEIDNYDFETIYSDIKIYNIIILKNDTILIGDDLILFKNSCIN